MKYLLSLISLVVSYASFSQTPVELANAQLEAYNNRDIEAFLIPYSDSVKVYNGEMQLLYQGKQTMRTQYATMFDQVTELNCKLLNRIAVGNTVIEHEEVFFGEDRKIYAIVMYKVSKNKIQEVHFLDRDQ